MAPKCYLGIIFIRAKVEKNIFLSAAHNKSFLRSPETAWGWGRSGLGSDEYVSGSIQCKLKSAPLGVFPLCLSLIITLISVSRRWDKNEPKFYQKLQQEFLLKRMFFKEVQKVNFYLGKLSKKYVAKNW